jgi:hypothetical protein
VPKWLALSGVIPFIALAPPVCKHLEPLLPTLVAENCDLAQVCLLDRVCCPSKHRASHTSPHDLDIANAHPCC